MSQPVYFQCKTGFLPSVKIKPAINLRNKNQRADKIGIHCRAKLQIMDEVKNVPDLIEDYYKRFKMQNHPSEPLSVSINFKEISQSQLESEMAKSKEEKLRVKSSKNKNRVNSQGSYLEQLKIKKAAETEKIKSDTKLFLHRLKSFPNRSTQIGKEDLTEKTLIQKQHEQSLKNSNKGSHPTLVSKTIDVSSSKKYYISKGSVKSRNEKNLNKNRMSAVFSICNQKKSKQQLKTIERLKDASQYPQKMPSPWREEETHECELPQHLHLMEYSIPF